MKGVVEQLKCGASFCRNAAVTRWDGIVEQQEWLDRLNAWKTAEGCKEHDPDLGCLLCCKMEKQHNTENIWKHEDPISVARHCCAKKVTCSRPSSAWDITNQHVFCCSLVSKTHVMPCLVCISVPASQAKCPQTADTSGLHETTHRTCDKQQTTSSLQRFRTDGTYIRLSGTHHNRHWTYDAKSEDIYALCLLASKWQITHNLGWQRSCHHSHGDLEKNKSFRSLLPNQNFD